ncbi:non-ribosomal peptide synthetase [Kribbella sp. NPDC051620]|uniref:non-ribosomal peptide synthetase n=1 Tax=Kribbella sp. NPDC051620 TaxID=3364120 RepID=UPI0037947BD9
MPIAARSIPQAFRSAVARYAGDPAVAQDGRTWSYQELDTMSTAVARGLLPQGVAPGDLVAVAAVRDVRLIAGILGVLKAGAAYLPIDSHWPTERTATIARHARPRLFLTTAGHAPAPEPFPTVQIDDLMAGTYGPGVLPEVTEDSPAYVMYTSGSTGSPKGVIQPHGTILNDVAALASVLGQSRPTMLASTSTAFDVSVFEILTTLLHGGLLLPVPSLLDPRPASATPGVVVSGVPSMIREFLRDNAEAASPAAVVCAGEAFDQQLHLELATAWPDARIINGYGQTETFYATTYVAPGPPAGASASSVPIGRTFAGKTTYVLDDRLRRLPPGEVGELYVGGVIGAGYHNEPGQTAERFVPDPFGAPGARMFRTGDLVRADASGELVYIGRVDFQGKINGARVDPAEVESALLSCDGVADAAAMIVTAGDEPATLVGYVVPEPGRDDLTAGVLRQQLVDRVPSYLIPAEVQFLGRIPRTPIGKVDRAELPAAHGRVPETGSVPVPAPVPESASASASASGEAAPDEPAELILQIYRRVLAIPDLRPDEDVFLRGANSLKIAALAVRIGRAFGVKCSMLDLLHHPSAAAFTTSIASGWRPVAAAEAAHG